MEMERFKETPVEAARRKGPREPHLHLAEWLFDRIADNDSGDQSIISREELAEVTLNSDS